MFITLTIDTQKVKKSKLKFKKRKFNPTNGWKRPIRKKYKSLWQHVKMWIRKPIKNGHYMMNGQVAMH
jgi:hypothetical protein